MGEGMCSGLRLAAWLSAAGLGAVSKNSHCVCTLGTGGPQHSSGNWSPFSLSSPPGCDSLRDEGVWLHLSLRPGPALSQDLTNTVVAIV